MPGRVRKKRKMSDQGQVCCRSDWDKSYRAKLTCVTRADEDPVWRSSETVSN